MMLIHLTFVIVQLLFYSRFILCHIIWRNIYPFHPNLCCVVTWKKHIVICKHVFVFACPLGSTLAWSAECKQCKHGKSLLSCHITTKVWVNIGRTQTRLYFTPPITYYHTNIFYPITEAKGHSHTQVVRVHIINQKVFLPWIVLYNIPLTGLPVIT